MRPAANVAAYQSPTPAHNNNWIMDTGASHHITQDLQQPTLAQPYPGSDQVLVGDGTVSQLCKTNHCSVEFFPDYFVVKDLKSGQALLRGPLKQDLYHLPLQPPSSIHSPHAFSSSLQSASIWHHILGHPAPKIIKHLSASFQIPIKSPTSFECSSCQCAKSHKLPFSDHNLKSTRPLELIYSDVWGPAPI
ncbi:retrotransposon-like protein, partial [Trifolium medium]|nr:retrotransposon-like protein [Trifolium medium]